MKALVFAALVAVSTPALAANHYIDGSPTFGQFVATCHVGGNTVEACKGGVLDTFAGFAQTTRQYVTCDYDSFWQETAKYAGRYFNLLPWQDAVAFIVTQPQVCTTDLGL